jgi:hypothetical protein
MIDTPTPASVIGSFEEAEMFYLRKGLALTPLQRLQALENMRQFNMDALERNPTLRWAAERLRESGD